jgi:hypothetical protein
MARARPFWRRSPLDRSTRLSGTRSSGRLGTKRNFPQSFRRRPAPAATDGGERERARQTDGTGGAWASFPGEDVAYGLIVATYRAAHGRHRGTGDGAAPVPPVAVRGPHPPPARRGRAGGRERQVQRQGARRADALAEGSVELAQAMVPQALALARGGG